MFSSAQAGEARHQSRRGSGLQSRQGLGLQDIQGKVGDVMRVHANRQAKSRMRGRMVTPSDAGGRHGKPGQAGMER